MNEPERPLVSVIIPNFRHAKYLRERIESVLRQTVRNIEVIILDDASPDDSCAIIRSYLADRRVSFHPNHINTGDPFRQWNKGLGLATGEWVWIAESDDIAEPVFLEQLLQLAQRHPRAGFLYSQSDVVDEQSRFVRSLASHYAGLVPDGRWDSEFSNCGMDEIKDYLILRNTIPNASACLIQRSLFTKIGMAATGFKLCGDWLTYVKLLAQTDIAYTPRVLNHYRVHTQTARFASERALVESLESYRVLNCITEMMAVQPLQREKVAACIFERFQYLLSQSDLPQIGFWADLQKEAVKFDRHFERRLALPAAYRLQTVVLYDSRGGEFSEQTALRERIPVGARVQVAFGPAVSPFRLDPSTGEGRIIIHKVDFLDPANPEQRIERADTDNGFAAISVGGTAVRLGNMVDGLHIFSWGGDPIITFHSANLPPGRQALVRVEMTLG